MFIKTQGNRKNSGVKLPRRASNIKVFSEIISRHNTKPKHIPKSIHSFTPKADISVYRKLLKFNSFLTLLVSTLSLILLFVLTEEIYSNNFILTSSVNALRILLALLTFLNIIVSYRYYHTYLKIRKAYKEIHKASSILDDRYLLKKLILEILIASCFVPPSVSWAQEFDQIGTSTTLSLDDIIFLPALFRAYFLLKFLYEISPFTSFRNKFYFTLLDVKSPLSFSLKSYISMRPFTSISAVSLLGLLLSGLALRVYEKSLPGLAYHSVWDQLYLLAMTQTTLGYGDTVPKTHVGSVLCIVSGIFGIFLYSYMVLSLTKFIDFGKKENELYNVLKYEYSIKHALKPSATLLIQRWWKLNRRRKAKYPRISEVFAFSYQKKKFSVERAKLVVSQIKSETQTIAQIKHRMEGKFKRCLNYLGPIEEYKEISREFLQEEENISKNIREIKSLLQNISVVNSINESMHGNRDPVKPHMKILQERATKKMFSRKSTFYEI